MTTAGSKPIAFLLAALAVIAIGCGTPESVSATKPEYTEGEGSVPKEIEQMALDAFAAYFNGTNLEIYGTASTTVGELRMIEPSNTSGWAETEQRDGDSVYAVFVTGDMSIQSPSVRGEKPNIAPIKAGRMLLDARGFVLGTGFWGDKKPASPPFGEQFDDR